MDAFVTPFAMKVAPRYCTSSVFFVDSPARRSTLPNLSVRVEMWNLFLLDVMVYVVSHSADASSKS